MGCEILGAWLDTTHPKPARPGELRWFTTVGGEDREVDGPGPHMIDGEAALRSIPTFIRATLSYNPDLARTNYASVLASLPEELRRAYRDGDFSVGLRDADYQVIPTAWVLAAEARWKPDGAHGLSMTAMALDPLGAARIAQNSRGDTAAGVPNLSQPRGKRRQTAPRRRQWLSAIAWTVRL